MPTATTSSIPSMFGGNWFECGGGWLCGSAANVVDDDDNNEPTPTHTLNTKARFLNNVWSALEYEEASSLGNGGMECVVDRSLDESDHDDDHHDDDSHTTTTSSWSSSIHSCQEPQERTSNMPVLRQLPSFGSTLGSNSLLVLQRSAGSTNSNKSALSFDPTIRNSNSTTTTTPPKRTSSLESATRLARLSIQPLFGSHNRIKTEPQDEESSTMDSKTDIKNKPLLQPEPTNSFIYLRQ